MVVADRHGEVIERGQWVAVVGLEAPWDDDALARAASLAVATAAGFGRAEGAIA